MATLRKFPTGAGPGRPKGSKSRDKAAVLDVCRRFKCDPIEGLIRVSQSLRDTPRKSLSAQKLEAWCYAELAQYCYPKLKAVEHSGKVQHELPLVVAEGPPPPS